MLLKDKTVNRMWTFLLGAVTIMFLMVGTAMVTVENRYLNGVQHLVTAALCGYGLYRLKKAKVNVTDLPSEQRTMFSMGFLLAIIGMGFNVGLWAFGFILLLGGILGIEKKKSIQEWIKDFLKRKK